MSRISEVIVGHNQIETYKCSSAVTDNDIGKPVKLSASDTVALCSDGDAIYGFINSVEVHTEDGSKVVGVQVRGRKWVLLSGSMAVGALAEAAANTAAGTANAGDFALVSTKAVVNADITDSATGAQIAAAVNALLADALLPKPGWRMIYGAGTTGTEALLEKL